MNWTRHDALEHWARLQAEAAARLQEGLDPEERVVAEAHGVLVTSRRCRSAARPGDVFLDHLRSWHVHWSHDGRPTVVLDHDPVIGPVRRRSRTILWWHLGGDLRDEERTTTSLPFRGRRRNEYRATVALLGSLSVPRLDDVYEVLPGTRDERLGASVRPYLLITTWRGRPPPLRSLHGRTRPPRRGGFVNDGGDRELRSSGSGPS